MIISFSAVANENSEQDVFRWVRCFPYRTHDGKWLVVYWDSDVWSNERRYDW